MYSLGITHAYLAAAVCILLMLTGDKFKQYQQSCNLGAGLFAVITALILLLLVMREYANTVDSITAFAVAFSKLDDEGRAAVGLQFPHMRYTMRAGRVRELFDNTQVPIATFRLFLQDSNERTIAPERNWYTTERPREAWQEIYNWLLKNKYILPDRVAANESWLWKGNSYRHLMAYWMAGREIQEME